MEAIRSSETSVNNVYTAPHPRRLLSFKNGSSDMRNPSIKFLKSFGNEQSVPSQSGTVVFAGEYFFFKCSGTFVDLRFGYDAGM
jgi:histidinol phosphatase-like enzyme